MYLILLPLCCLQTPPEKPSLVFEALEASHVELFAESPMLFNPTCMDVDDKGQVWVCEGVNYRQWEGKNPGKHHDEGDRIVVLRDTDGDGKADTSTVFAQDKDLTSPLGIAVIGDAVYVSNSPDLFIYRDLDGDGVADQREVVLSGFGGHNHDHGLHSVVPHPDGSLLWCVGNAGPHLVEDKSGFHLRSGSVYNGGGESHPGNRSGLVSDDGRAWTGGLIGRMALDGSEMRVLAHNFRNQYEVAVDGFGRMYTFDNDDDGNQAVRAVCLTEGGNYGFFSADGARAWQADRRGGMSTQEAHWHQNDPGVMPMGTVTGSGAPCGVTVYEHDLFPELTGQVLAADAGRSMVYRFDPKVQGGGVVLQERVLLRPGLEQAKNAEGEPGEEATAERGRWFRPSDVAVGPDGAIYVADWFDPGVGGHWAGDREAYGRILCLRPNSAKRISDQRKKANDHLGQLKLANRVWTLSRAEDFPMLAKDAVNEALAFAYRNLDERLRSTVLHACLSAGIPAEDLAEHFVDDVSPYVRAQLAAALRDVPWIRSGKHLTHLAIGYDAQDRVSLEALGLGAEGKESDLYLELLERLGPDKDKDAFFDLAWRLHPAEALAYLKSQAEGESRDWSHRAKALDAIAQMPEREAAEYVVAQSLAGQKDMREYAAAWVQQRRGNLWAAYGLEDKTREDFGAAQLLWRSEVLTEVPVEAFANLEGVHTLWLVVEDGENGNSYDWATWVNPIIVTENGETRLEEIPWKQESAGWGQTRWNQSADGRPITVGGELVPYGLGTHAPAKVAFSLPPGAREFRVRCAPDDGGRQGSTRPSIRFAIYGERFAEKVDHLSVQQAVLDGDLDAAEQLVGTVPGALFLLEQQRESLLPAEVVTAVESQLQNHPDLSVRGLASELFPMRTMDGNTLPSIRELIEMAGNPAHGRELFRGRATCVACHRYEGVGGAIGPDLTAIGEKYGRSGILDSMLHPSASMAFGYDNWNLVLKDGQHLAGSILADGDAIVLRDFTGSRHVVEASEVKTRRKSQVSTMPAALALGLNAQDLVDLATFLAFDSAKEPVFDQEFSLFNGVDLNNWNFFLNNDGQKDKVWSVQDGVLRCEGNPTGYLYTKESYTNFELTLEWRFDPAAGGGNSGVLMRVQPPHKTWPHSIEAQLQSGHAGDIWNIGEFPMLTDAKRSDGRRTENILPSNEKPIGEWNRYRIRLHGSRLTLEVNGEVQNTAVWCEEKSGPICLQSEGVPIEFRNVRLKPIQ